MDSLLIDTNEWGNRRFEDLCERLEEDGEPSKYLVMGHLIRWCLKWASDQETDAGLLWEITEKRLGVWAEWPKPLLFGRALVAAGYVQTVESVFPPELCRGRTGFMVPMTLDRAWNMLRHRCNARELVLFLTDPIKRSIRAAELGLTPDQAPAGWLLSADEARPLAAKQQAGATSAPAGGQRWPNVGPTLEQRNPAGQPSAPNVDVNVKEDTNVSTSNVGQNENGGTGSQKTGDLLAFLRQNKTDNPLACLRRIDGTDRAGSIWVKAVETDPDAVITKLANMVETDTAWCKICSPAAVMMACCMKIIKPTRRRNG